MNDVKIENILGLEKPLVKFIDVASKGIGKVYEPIYQKKMIQVEVEKINMISEAIEQNLELPIKYSNGKLKIDTTSVEELAKRAKGRFLYQEIIKQNNIENILHKTYNLLKQEQIVSDEKVNDDWILRFFNSIEDISDEKMQEIWAKILAGEIVQPKSVSLRTLEKLKNISSEEAMIFQKICEFAVQNTHNTIFLLKENDLLKKYNCKFSYILQSEECGLISANGFINVNIFFNENNEKTSLLHNKEIIGIIKSKKESELKISAYTLTKAGMELYKIITNIKPNNEYFLEYLRNINNKEEYEVKAYKIKTIKKDRIEYDNNENILINTK